MCIQTERVVCQNEKNVMVKHVSDLPCPPKWLMTLHKNNTPTFDLVLAVGDVHFRYDLLDANAMHFNAGAQ